MYNHSATSDSTRSYSDKIDGVILMHLRPQLLAEHQTRCLHFISNSPVVQLRQATFLTDSLQCVPHLWLSLRDSLSLITLYCLNFAGISPIPFHIQLLTLKFNVLLSDAPIEGFATFC